jgi:hypothetical protein
MSEQSFIAQMQPYAEEAAAATGFNADLILAQWGDETGWGTSEAWTQRFNPAGIGITGTGVAGDNYGSVAGGVQAYINFVNNNSRYQAVKAADGSIEQQAVALGESGWAAGQYNAGGGPGSSLIEIMQGMGVNVNAGVSAYQTPTGVANAPAATGATGGGGAAPAAAASGVVATENIPGYGNVGVTAQQESAYDTIESTFAAYGFSPSQTKTLSQWAWGEITQNVDPTQIALDLQTPGTLGYSVFVQVFPGFVQANQELVAQGLPAVSVANYAQYQTQAQAMAQAAGLPAGFINKEDIGQLIGHNVSTTELSNRLTDASALAYQSTAEQRNMFNQYFGTQYEHDTYIGEPGGTKNNDSGHGPLTNGQIAAIVLDPQKAEPLIHQQITAAQIGGAGVTAGLGAISQPLATKLAQAGVTDAQALSGFQQIGPLAPLEKNLPGLGGENKQAQVGVGDLAEAQFLGIAGATRHVQVAEEVRKAPFSGGGGFQINTRGSGVGSANNLGPTQTNS